SFQFPASSSQFPAPCWQLATGSHSFRHRGAHQLERFRHLLEIEADRRRAPEPRILALLVEDWKAVIERVELLSEMKCVLGEDRQLERAHCLIDHFVEPRGL